MGEPTPIEISDGWAPWMRHWKLWAIYRPVFGRFAAMSWRSCRSNNVINNLIWFKSRPQPDIRSAGDRVLLPTDRPTRIRLARVLRLINYGQPLALWERERDQVVSEWCSIWQPPDGSNSSARLCAGLWPEALYYRGYRSLRRWLDGRYRDDGVRCWLWLKTCVPLPVWWCRCCYSWVWQRLLHTQ